MATLLEAGMVFLVLTIMLTSASSVVTNIAAGFVPGSFGANISNAGLAAFLTLSQQETTIASIVGAVVIIGLLLGVYSWIRGNSSVA